MDCLFLPPLTGDALAAELRVYWLPASGEGAWLSLAECAALATGALALVVPAEVASAFAVSVPTQKARWLRQALPYAVEELLAEEVEQLHLALGETLADGRQRVIAIRRSLLQGWLQQLQALGLSIGAIYLDADLLPRTGSQVLLQGPRGLLGGAGEARLAFSRGAWPALATQLAEPLAVRDGEQEAPYRWLAQGLTQAVNLAQGEFAVRNASRGWQPWQPALALAGLWLVVQLGFNLAQGWYWQHEGERYAQASRALYQQLFPQDTRIVNLRAQFAEHLAQGAQTAGSGFLRLSQQAATALASEPGLQVLQLDYSASRGDFALQVQAADFAALEQLRQRLSAAGLNVALGSASREAGGVTARVVIGG